MHLHLITIWQKSTFSMTNMLYVRYIHYIYYIIYPITHNIAYYVLQDPFDSQSSFYDPATRFCLCEVEKSVVTILLPYDSSVQIQCSLNGCIVEDVRKGTISAFPRLSVMFFFYLHNCLLCCFRYFWLFETVLFCFVCYLVLAIALFHFLQFHSVSQPVFFLFSLFSLKHAISLPQPPRLTAFAFLLAFLQFEVFKF